jgi:uncharacterized protein
MAEKKYLLETWREIAYNQNQTQQQFDAFWDAYFVQEKEVYKDILGNKDVVVKGTIKELADKYNMEVLTMVGFLDGINDSLKVSNPIDTFEEDTEVSLEYDPELLYKNMVEAKADWLYGLEEWNDILTERQKELYREQKKSGTIVKEKKIGRNDPCPCGSGKKYKFCCGR